MSKLVPWYPIERKKLIIERLDQMKFLNGFNTFGRRGTSSIPLTERRMNLVIPYGYLSA